MRKKFSRANRVLLPAYNRYRKVMAGHAYRVIRNENVKAAEDLISKIYKFNLFDYDIITATADSSLGRYFLFRKDLQVKVYR